MTATHPDWSDDFQDDIQCPHCGKHDSEHTDYPSTLRYDGDHTEVECPYCGAEHEVVLCVTYEYSSRVSR